MSFRPLQRLPVLTCGAVLLALLLTVPVPAQVRIRIQERRDPASDSTSERQIYVEDSPAAEDLLTRAGDLVDQNR
ncbi:MAG: hypothetical protein R3336_09530, partial [Phycisphaeraceae bacterium]|nr:hypothetical protein [Phycisphaeraceae bacterium]